MLVRVWSSPGQEAGATHYTSLLGISASWLCGSTPPLLRGDGLFLLVDPGPSSVVAERRLGSGPETLSAGTLLVSPCGLGKPIARAEMGAGEECEAPVNGRIFVGLGVRNVATGWFGLERESGLLENTAGNAGRCWNLRLS